MYHHHIILSNKNKGIIWELGKMVIWEVVIRYLPFALLKSSFTNSYQMPQVQPGTGFCDSFLPLPVVMRLEAKFSFHLADYAKDKSVTW